MRAYVLSRFKQYATAAITAMVLTAAMPLSAADADGIVTAITNYNSAHGGSGTLFASASGNTVTVTGDVTGATQELTLDIDHGVTLEWQASLVGDVSVLNSPGLINLTGSGTFKMTDGLVRNENTNSSSRTIRNSGTGTLNISGGMVEAPRIAIYNAFGEINVSSGTIKTATGRAIENISTGEINVSSGTVEATGSSGRAIENASTGTVKVSGGTIKATSARAINNNSTGKVIITDGTVESTTSGGTVEATGGGNSIGTLDYRWNVDGSNVGTGNPYTVQTSDLGKTITLEITSSVETGTITSEATAAVLKKAAPNAPAAPTVASKTHNSITLTPTAGYEYSMNGTDWQTSNAFTGLTANTPYTFYQRVAETDDTYVSAASEKLDVTTEPTAGIASNDRNIPQSKPDDVAAVIPPVNVSAFEVSVGPNPVRKSDNGVNIFITGKRIDKGELTVFDATGNVVQMINVNDNVNVNGGGRVVGSWDLHDAKGRAVPEGTYLLRGVVKTIDGRRERVSVIIGVR